jgi:hypothetical protein
MLYVYHRSVLPAPLARPEHRPSVYLSRRANTISIAQGAELLARYGSDARTTGVVPLELGNCRHRKYPRSKAETQYSLAT